MNVLFRIIAGFAGLVFIATGILKTLGADTFRDAVEQHGLVPESLVGPFAAAFPWGEIAGGLAAIVLAAMGRASAALWTVAALFGLLAAYSLGVALWPPEGEVPCGCGFGTMIDNWWVLVLRNGVLCAALALLVCWKRLATRPAAPDQTQPSA